MLSRLVQMVLARYAGGVDVVRTGTEALTAIAHKNYDAIACDISLPDMSGLDVIARLREQLPACGIVAVTGLVDVDVAVQSMKAGADDFMGKPFDAEVLWHILNKAADTRARHLEAEQAAMYRRLAYTDALTGAPNRRFLDEYLLDAVERARNEQQPLTLAYIDIDNFKLLNDFLGHDLGDRILCDVADALRTYVTPPGEFARFGGDEFLAIFPGLTHSQVERRIDRVRRSVTNLDVANRDRLTLPTRISCGIAEFRGHETPQQLVREAEDAMYLDKSVTQTMDSMPAGNSPMDPVIKVKNLKALRNLVKAIDRRDTYTRFHSDHATHLAALIGRQIGLGEEHMTAMMIAGPIHDLGKICVPDEILRKPGPLSPEERRTMEEHPVMGAAITAAVTDYDSVVNLVRHHHERFDGGGYPQGLGGDAIWLPTRVFTICDAYSAMTTDRPYRRGLTMEQALAEIERGSGSQFDPDVAKEFIGMVEREFLHAGEDVRAA